MSKITCRFCESEAGDGDALGDDTLYLCPNCGGYRLTRSAAVELESGAIATPTRSQFAELVARLRRDSTEYPTVTTYDLKSL